jgi:adenine-specific DNA-methyltransferase
VIKYLGSKRVLVPLLGDIAERVGARTAVDLFTGTTRVAQELKRRGLVVTATDLATYSQVLSDCYIATDASRVDRGALTAELARLNGLPGEAGYVTRTFCE